MQVKATRTKSSSVGFLVLRVFAKDHVEKAEDKVFCDWMTYKLNFLYFLSILHGGSDANYMML